jgi:ATP synthase, Delta/Epsilon chain, beta-sandwich domain
MSNARPDDPKVLDEGFATPLGQEEEEQARAAQQLSSKKSDKPTMEVKVASPFNTYYTGQAFSLSGVNATGPFDILPEHHNFISLLEPCTLVIRTVGGEEQKIDISGGLIHVKADRVTVFLDI